MAFIPDSLPDVVHAFVPVADGRNLLQQILHLSFDEIVADTRQPYLDDDDEDESPMDFSAAPLLIAAHVRIRGRQVASYIDRLPRRKTRTTRHRGPRLFYDTLLRMEDSVFEETLRMEPDTFFYLVDVLNTHLVHDPYGRGAPLQFGEQIAIALYRLAMGNSYRTIGDTFAVGTTTVLNCVRRVVKAINTVLYPRAVRFFAFNDGDGWEALTKTFRHHHLIDGAVGAIDGTHIGIMKPRDDTLNAYINRKRYNSILFQAVVDGNGNFLDVCGGLAGSVHDSRLFSVSAVYKKLLNGTLYPARPIDPSGNRAECNDTFFLLGDSGYGVRDYMMTPIASPANAEETEFNHIHSSARMVVESTFGILKCRFRILLGEMAAAPEFAREVTYACVALHNILNSRGDTYTREWMRTVAVNEEVVDADARHGRMSFSVRDRTAANATSRQIMEARRLAIVNILQTG